MFGSPNPFPGHVRYASRNPYARGSANARIEAGLAIACVLAVAWPFLFLALLLLWPYILFGGAWLMLARLLAQVSRD